MSSQDWILVVLVLVMVGSVAHFVWSRMNAGDAQPAPPAPPEERVRLDERPSTAPEEARPKVALEAKKPEAKKPEAKKPEAKKPEVEAPKSDRAEPREKKPETIATPAATKTAGATAPSAMKKLKQTIIGLGTDSSPPSSAPPASAPSPTSAPPESGSPSSQDFAALSSRPPGVGAPPPMPGVAAVPRVTWEEDEEVEPTRVGRTSAGVAGRVVLQAPVKRIVFDEDADIDEPTLSQSVFLVHATAQTDRGKRRKRNEDSLLVLENAGLFVVADGMGGYRGGEIASNLAVNAIAKAFTRREFEGEPHPNIPKQATELARAMQSANATILERSQEEPELEGMGTTLCAALFSPNKKRLYIGHVGDSRCYRLRDGVLTQMTHDHTMEELGAKGPESLQLSRAVGIWASVPIDILIAQPQIGDAYLLCSDGLTKMLSDDVIANVVRNEEDPRAAVERLVLFANSRGGKDNVTIILVRVVPPNWKPKAASSPQHDVTAAKEQLEAPDVLTVPPPNTKPTSTS